MISTIHRGQYFQRGRGLGGIFASIMRILKPIVTRSIAVGKRALADPTVKKAVASVKKSSVAAGTRALNKQLKKIAPAPKPASTSPLSIPKAKKRIARVNTIVKNKVRKKASNIFNDFK